MKKWLLFALLASCAATGDTPSRSAHSTFSVAGGSSMTLGTLAGAPSREFRISKDGILLIRVESHGVELDLEDFPGSNVHAYFTSLSHLPLRLDLPDGTRFVFHGDSFEVGEERYELPEGGGIVRYVHPGQLLSP